MLNMTTRSLAFLIFIISQCCAPGLDPKNYVTDVEAITEASGQSFEPPPALLWMIYNFMNIGIGRSWAKRDRNVERQFIPIQYEIFLQELDDKRTLQFDFSASDSREDWAIDLTRGYASVPMFKFADPNKNKINIHRGIICSLLHPEFIRQMEEDLIGTKDFGGRLAPSIIHQQLGILADRGKQIDNILISGHSVGGAYAQAFYFLLYADKNVAPPYITQLRQLLHWPEEYSYNADRTRVTIPIISDAWKSKIYVVTTGAFLILPTTKNFITDIDVDQKIIDDSRVYNIIKRNDIVTKIFGGKTNMGPLLDLSPEQLTGREPAQLLSLKKAVSSVTGDVFKIGTATPVGKYLILTKDHKRSDIVNRGIKLLKFQDIPGKPYLTQHLQNGCKDSGIPATKSKPAKAAILMTIFAVPFAVVRTAKFIGAFSYNHNEYTDDLNAWSESYDLLNKIHEYIKSRAISVEQPQLAIVSPKPLPKFRVQSIYDFPEESQLKTVTSDIHGQNIKSLHEAAKTAGVAQAKKIDFMNYYINLYQDDLIDDDLIDEYYYNIMDKIYLEGYEAGLKSGKHQQMKKRHNKQHQY